MDCVAEPLPEGISPPQPQIQIDPMQAPVSAVSAGSDPQQTVSASLIPGAPAVPNPAFPKNLKTHLGKKVWYCLNAQSQQDLQTAQRLAAESGEQPDPAVGQSCSATLARLLLAVVLREVVEPFVAALGEYWLEQTGDTQLGDLSLDPDEFKTPSVLTTLAMLLAPTWQAIQESVLKMPLEPAAADLYILAGNPDDEAAADARYQATEFLQTWEHPLAGWMQRDLTAAASLLAQVGQLIHVALEQERFPQGGCFAPLARTLRESRYPWQLNLLQQKILGTSSESGLLQLIYGGS
jgi:hypothetical protein